MTSLIPSACYLVEVWTRIGDRAVGSLLHGLNVKFFLKPHFIFQICGPPDVGQNWYFFQNLRLNVGSSSFQSYCSPIFKDSEAKKVHFLEENWRLIREK